MNKHVMKTFTRHVEKYFEAMLEDNSIMCFFYQGAICASYGYNEDADVYDMGVALSEELSHMRTEQRQYKSYYTRVCNSDIIIDTEE